MKPLWELMPDRPESRVLEPGDVEAEWLVFQRGFNFFSHVRHNCVGRDSDSDKHAQTVAFLIQNELADRDDLHNWRCDRCNVEVPDELKAFLMLLWAGDI